MNSGTEQFLLLNKTFVNGSSTDVTFCAQLLTVPSLYQSFTHPFV